MAPGGSVLVVDERVADTFVAPGDQVERLMYGSASCAAFRAEWPTTLGGHRHRHAADTLRRYAADAGFGATEVLPIANDFFRYRLRP